MNPLYEMLSLPVLGALALFLGQFIYRQMTKPAAPAPAPAEFVNMHGVLVRLPQLASIDFRTPGEAHVSAGNELYNFYGQEADEIAAYFKVEVPRRIPPAKTRAAAE